MNAARTLINTLHAKGIELAVNGDKLSVKAPVGTVTDELRRTLTEHKAEIIDLLSRKHPGTAGAAVHVWQFRIDDKLVTAIDHDRQSEADFLRFLQNKFGPDRVSDLCLMSAKPFAS